MRSPSHPSPKNHLLAALAAADLALLQPHLKQIVLPLRYVFEKPNVPIRRVYFMEEGFGSVVAMGQDEKEIEAGLIGREGMSGLPVVMGTDRSPNAMFVQFAGHGQSLAASELRTAMASSGTMTKLFLRFAQAFSIQTAQAALANGRGIIEERLARWLLMAHDRVDGDEFFLTHDFLALMLGVRRAGVTAGLHMLERKALIRSHRARLIVLDRAGLETLADGFYGVPEAEYRRLIGGRSRHPR